MNKYDYKLLAMGLVLSPVLILGVLWYQIVHGVWLHRAVSQALEENADQHLYQ